MPTTLQHIKGRDLPDRLACSLNVRPEKLYTLEIEIREETATPPTAKASANKRHNPLFGLWRDRTDIGNPTQWVTDLRQPHFYSGSRTPGIRMMRRLGWSEAQSQLAM